MRGDSGLRGTGSRMKDAFGWVNVQRPGFDISRGTHLSACLRLEESKLEAQAGSSASLIGGSTMVCGQEVSARSVVDGQATEELTATSSSSEQPHHSPILSFLL